jgi:hypothetical protein
MSVQFTGACRRLVPAVPWPVSGCVHPILGIPGQGEHHSWRNVKIVPG